MYKQRVHTLKPLKIFETGAYNNSILVYVPADNTKINIGIQVENSTAELDWTAFDNFQMKYCGDNDMVLDEDKNRSTISPNNNLCLPMPTHLS